MKAFEAGFAEGREGHRAEKGKRCCPCYERANAAEAELPRAEQRGREEERKRCVDLVRGKLPFAPQELLAALILEEPKP